MPLSVVQDNESSNRVMLSIIRKRARIKPMARIIVLCKSTGNIDLEFK